MRRICSLTLLVVLASSVAHSQDASNKRTENEARSGLAYLQGGHHILRSTDACLFFPAANSAVRSEIGIDVATGNRLHSIIDQYCQEKSGLRFLRFESLRTVADNKHLSEEELKRLKDEEEKSAAASQAVCEKLIAEFKAALTASQLERLQQIAWQIYGSEAWVFDSRLSEALNLSGDQKQKITAINQQNPLSTDSARLRVELPFEKYLETFNQKNGKAKEVLTAEQQEKLKTLEGMPFDFKKLISNGPQQPFGWIGGGAGILMTAGNRAVQKELTLDEETVSKLNAIKQKFFVARRDAGAWRGMSVRLADGSQHTFYVPMSAPWDFGEWNATIAKFLPELKEAVNAEQFQRLKQIDWQAKGAAALFDPEVITRLALTQTQQDQIVATTYEFRDRRRALGESPPDGKRIEKMTQLIKEHDEKIDSLLTKEQRDERAVLLGKPFELERLRGMQAAFVPLGPQVRVNTGDFTYGGIFSTLSNEPVQKELGLSDEIVVAVKTVTDQYNRAWNAAGGGFRIRTVSRSSGGRRQFQEAAMPPWRILPIPGQTPEARQQEIVKMKELWYDTIAKFLPRLKEILTEEQFARLQQINWQSHGTAAYTDPDVIKGMAITPDQLRQINKITEEYQGKLNALMTARGSDVQEKITELLKERDATINSVFTKEQLEQFAKMVGEPFDLTQIHDVPPGLGRGGAPPQ